ncbi:MAG: hypothetical protein P8X39_12270 [Desulfofustis sp.]|jgi:hypothetical protein
MDRFALPEGSNWIIIIAIFGVSISLAGFTSKWLSGIFPFVSRHGFLVYLALTTLYFCIVTIVMKQLM